jgi:hypothetical protein
MVRAEDIINYYDVDWITSLTHALLCFSTCKVNVKSKWKLHRLPDYARDHDTLDIVSPRH